VAADPYHESIGDLRRFIAKEHLSGVSNFYFVTGKLSTLKRVWANYVIEVSMKRTDKMSIHSDYFSIINPALRLKWVMADNPLASWAGQHSGAQEIVQLLNRMGVR
jgi:cytochrome oxidase Cu insertion factor (SCO1/SenC/PrrC family)